MVTVANATQSSKEHKRKLQNTPTLSELDRWKKMTRRPLSGDAEFKATSSRELTCSDHSLAGERPGVRYLQN